MASLFDSLDPELLRTNTPDVISSMMDMIRKHQVHLKGIVSTVVVSLNEQHARCWRAVVLLA
jgi:hypothetical protein